ncbi:hypothetical protein KEH51_10155 [[Brevibacterium] frigoritolerans]|uniref:Uncharacterized protein n=1 Tax=Peribacillus frigoritolerans TaxID=450367 RepID=A0A941FKZ5_9BACI|nr:hypothetical protein [Peribacillus frigoritolerans]
MFLGYFIKVVSLVRNTREFRCFTREFVRNTREFWCFTGECRSNTRE